MGRTPAGETRRKVFEFVRERIAAGLPPTVREVQHAFGFRSPQSAREHLEALVATGHLAKQPGLARGYRLTAIGSPPALVPLVGRVAAGALTEAIEHREGYVAVESMRGADELFALRVDGESMTGIGIFPGDIVIVRRQARVASNDIVVALVGDQATVKRLRVRRGRPELHAENPAFAPILPAPDELRILGKVIEVRRVLER